MSKKLHPLQCRLGPRRHGRCLLWLAVTHVASIAGLAAAEIRVPQDSPGIQEAISAAEDGDTVLVAPGVYEIDRPVSFLGKRITVRSDEGPEATTVRMVDPADPNRASVFVLENAEPPSTRLEGFTIEGGRGLLVHNLPLPWGEIPEGRFGGGIYVGSHAEPIIASCVLRENRAHIGGGIGCDVDSRVRLHDMQWIDNETVVPNDLFQSVGGGLACLADGVVEIETSLFVGNEAEEGGAVYVSQGGKLAMRDVHCSENRSLDGDGGAIDSDGDTLELERCVFERNVAEDDGGGVHVRGYSCVLQDCTFEYNRAGDSAGGFFADIPPLRPDVSLVRGCRFLQNVASDAGGGAMIGYESSMVRFEDSTFERNASNLGGGIYFDYESHSEVVGSVFQENQATIGGGVFTDESYTQLRSCTLAGNAAGLAGGICFRRGSTLITHCLVWANTGGSLIGRWGDVPPAGHEYPGLSIENCCIEGAEPPHGPGNINLDPLFEGWPSRPEVFVDAAAPEGGDGRPGSPYRKLAEALSGYSYALSPESPCRGGALDGADIGADTGVAATVHPPSRRSIHLAEGTYRMNGLHLGHGASLEGEGAVADDVIVAGTIFGLRSGETVRNLTVTGGVHGGIVVGSRESPRIEATRIWRNHHQWPGAAVGLWLDSEPELTGCDIEENFGQGWGSVVVSGFYPAGARLSHCRIVGNHCGFLQLPLDVGSSVISYSGSLRLTNSLIAGNRVSDLVRRDDRALALPLLSHCTFANNLPTSGWMMRDPQLPGPLARSCIFWDRHGSQFQGAVEDSIIQVDPAFVREGAFDFERTISLEVLGIPYDFPDFIIDRGDYQLRFSSAAIDAAGPEEAPETDLAGESRPCWSAFDIGAYEYCGAETPSARMRFRRGEVNLDGRTDLSDAISILGYLFLSEEPLACLKSADMDDSGELDITDAIRLLQFLFVAGGPPPRPFEECGLDPSRDEIPCTSYPPCAELR